MKTIKMVKIPLCDICKKNEAVYDAPMVNGSWAYMCQNCSEVHGSANKFCYGSRLEAK